MYYINEGNIYTQLQQKSFVAHRIRVIPVPIEVTASDDYNFENNQRSFPSIDLPFVKIIELW